MPNNRTKFVKRMDISEISWVAGFLEGEGCFYWDARAKTARISACSTDLDNLKRLQQATGVGSINVKKSTSDAGYNVKPMWEWKIASCPCFLDIVCSIVPLMSVRRRAKILEITDCILDQRSKVPARYWMQYNKRSEPNPVLSGRSMEVN